MRIKTKVVTIALAAFVAARLCAQTNDALVRVALVSDSGDNEVAKILALATVKLSQGKGIELLDRDAIRRVLGEQNLSLAGTVNPNSVVSAGRLLSVDLFAVVETVTETNDTTNAASAVAAGLAVLDAKTGVRLWDATLPADGVEKMAESVAAGVLMAQRKRIAIGLPTICLMSVRNADLPRSLDRLCDSVGLLLERRLMASAKCAVLERQRLDQVNRERELPGSAGQPQLVASLVIMEMECGRGPDGRGMRAEVRLADNNGRWPAGFSVTNPNANADELARGLYQKVAEALKLGSGASDGKDRDKESARFRQEAEFFLSHDDWERGVAGLEAAFALAPDARGLRRELAGALIADAGATIHLLPALRCAERGTELFLECARVARRKAKPDSPRRAYDFTHQFQELDAYMRNFGGDTFKIASLSPDESEEARQLLHSIYEQYRSFRLDIALPALFEAILHHPDDSTLESRDMFHDYGFVMLAGLWSTENIAALYPEDWSQDWLANLKGYLNLLEKLPLGKQSAGEIKFNLHSLVLWPPTWQKVNPAEREQAWRLMAAHPSPLVNAYGKLSQLNTAQDEAKQREETLPPVDRSYRLYLQDRLTHPAQSPDLVTRRLLYEAATGYGVFRNLGGEEMVSLCDFMLQLRDLYPPIIDSTVSFLLSQTNNHPAHAAVEFLDRAIFVLQQTNGHYFGDSSAKEYLQALSRQREVAQNKAEGVHKRELTPLPPAWREFNQLVDLAGAKGGLGWIFRPVVKGDTVYAAGFGTEGTDGKQFLQLLKIPLKDGAMQALGKIAVESVPWEGGGCHWGIGWESPETRVRRQLSFPRAACVDGENYYLGTAQGIFVFPKDGGAVQRLCQTNGLPSDDVTALDYLDGTLYIALGESGYLVGYDLKQRRYEALCSARRREQLSPFDNGSPLGIPMITADEQKRRVLFVANQDGGGGNWLKDLQTVKETKEDVFPGICAKARAGLWLYIPAAREFKAMLPRHPNAQINDVSWIGRVGDTRIMMSCRGGQEGAALFDFATDTPTLFYGSCCAIGLEGGMEAMARDRGIPVNPALHYGPLFDHSLNLSSGSFIYGSWIWTARRHVGKSGAPDENTFSRISMESGRIDDLPSPRPSCPSFNPEECFRLIAPDQALMGDQCGLWLVVLAAETAETKSARR